MVMKSAQKIKPVYFQSLEALIFGPPYWIRTSDLRLRRPLLYPTELRAAGWRVRETWILTCIPGVGVFPDVSVD